MKLVWMKHGCFYCCTRGRNSTKCLLVVTQCIRIFYEQHTRYPLLRVCCNPCMRACFNVGEVYITVMSCLYLPSNYDNFPWQAGHVWGNIFVKQPNLPEVCDWGWQRNGLDASPIPKWTTLPLISRLNLKELAVCGCKSGACRPPCQCCRHEQICTSLCGCKGSCIHTEHIRQS